ncbi:MFS transporter [Demequina aurantiaca]|uniref:MFS transporter n=1 Tax=Demequina aurantiaca TaxID=676200 RepID=UPI0007853560|nr:MFS transporter [Demequina aurantiaca]
MARSEPRREVVRDLATSTYIPTFLAEIGIGAVLPVLALSVLSFDYDSVVASLAVAAYSIGRIVGSALGGRLSAGLGPARAAMVMLAVLAAGAAICAASPMIMPFAVGALTVGVGHAGYHIARQGQVNAAVSAQYRARALTTLAGVWRIANFVGPLMGAAIIGIWGIHYVYVAAVIAAVAAMVALRLSPAWHLRLGAEPEQKVSPFTVVKDNAKVFRTLGIAVVFTGAVRAARLVVLPLWATHVGLSPQVATLIFGINAAVDMVLFYPAGVVMDRFGRVWTAVPSSLMLGLGTIALTWTSGALGVTLAAIVLGIGNGWGSGLIMTLAADVAPRATRSVFTGVWSIAQDAGGFVGPMAVSVGAAIALPVGFWLVGGVGIATAYGMYRWIPPWRGNPSHPQPATPLDL